MIEDYAAVMAALSARTMNCRYQLAEKPIRKVLTGVALSHDVPAMAI